MPSLRAAQLEELFSRWAKVAKVFAQDILFRFDTMLC